MQKMQEMRVGSLGQEDSLEKWKWPSPTPVFLTGKFHGQRCLAGYSLWGHKVSDLTEHASINVRECIDDGEDLRVH